MYSLSITTLLYAVTSILIIMLLTLLYRFARFKTTWQQRVDELESQLQQERQRFLELDRDYAILHTRFEEQNRFNAKSMQLLEEAKSALSQQFETVAHQIFEQKNRSFEATHNKQIELLLKPFREQINNFSKQTQHHYENEAKERHLLKDEIGRLKELNLRISQDALNLTQALRGDNKMQGNWGEVVLERILEESGLREGHEYEIQTSHRDSDGKLLRPDVLVHLPQGREIIIDSKVSLVAYETFMSSDDPQVKTNALKQHIASIEAHVKGLSNKRYEALERLHTLDFVLLFMPIEGAFLLALEQDGGFFRRAYDHNIIIVSPSTLLVTLRTIEHIWRRERQEENAKEIAKKAEDLYDKFVGFVEDMNRIGEQIDKSRETYDDAMNKLVSGRGNLVRRVEMIKELGLKPKKQLRSDLLEGEDA